MHILVINGPNLNLLGTRQVEIYGNKTYQDLENILKEEALNLDISIEIHQTNFEGIIIDLLHYAKHKNFDGILLNAAAYTHYSYAIYDAILAIHLPVVEVHLTDLASRKEAFRRTSVIEDACIKTFSGKGFDSYIEALNYLSKEVSK
ncbi:MAG: type II 3-dehydroquinate dehydratase [Candidatus Izemoplasmataceae bacterium]